MRKTHRFLCLVLVGLLAISCRMANAQDADITLEARNEHWGFDLTVINGTSSPDIDSIRVEITGANFDFESTPTFNTAAPELGGNNDGVRSRVVTWTTGNPLVAGDTWRATGDIDGNDGPDTASATITWSDGSIESVDLQQSGDTFTGQINGDPPAPPGPIVDGSGKATPRWTPPIERENGVPLEPGELDGYVLYWGLDSRVGRCGSYPQGKNDPCYDNFLDIPNGATLSRELDIPLTEDASVYFAVVAYLVDDEETLISAYSPETRRDFAIEVNQEPPPSPPGAPVVLDVAVTVTCTTDTPGVTCNITVN